MKPAEQKLFDKLKSETFLPSWKAYLMATAKHETANTFLPIEERGSDTYLSKYWTNLKLRKWLKNQFASDAVKYKGRGFVQITGRGHYHTASKVVGLDLITYPDKAEEWDIAYEILVHFCIHGLFTGAKLGTYLKSNETDFIGARRVVNGIDKADLIAAYANQYLQLFI